jgi:hypothetical protein
MIAEEISPLEQDSKLSDSDEFVTLEEAVGSSEPVSGGGTQGTMHDTEAFGGVASGLNIVDDVDSSSSPSQSQFFD